MIHSGLESLYMKPLLKALAPVLCLAGLGLSGAANAIVVFCPGTLGTTDREFSVDTTAAASCLDFGTGNINGNNDDINLLGFVTIDKTDDGTSGIDPDALTTNPLNMGLSGTFSFTPTAGFTDFVIAFKSGEGQLDPDWAAFRLPDGVTSGSWTISGEQALSHANLYAIPGNEVPEAGTLALLGLTLAGLAFLRRRS